MNRSKAIVYKHPDDFPTDHEEEMGFRDDNQEKYQNRFNDSEGYGSGRRDDRNNVGGGDQGHYKEDRQSYADDNYRQRSGYHGDDLGTKREQQDRGSRRNDNDCRYTGGNRYDEGGYEERNYNKINYGSHGSNYDSRENNYESQGNNYESRENNYESQGNNYESSGNNYESPGDNYESRGDNYESSGNNYDERGGRQTERHFYGDDNGKRSWGKNQNNSGMDRGFRGRGSSRGGRMIRGSNNNEDEGQRYGGFNNRDTRGCFKCGGDHLARDCTETQFGEIPGDNKRKPVTYVPEERNDDDEYNSISKGINFDKYENIPVDVTGNDPPRPISSFEECSINELLKRNVKRANYDKPTPIQKWSIPVILKGRDLMACAQTGSGKTAGFLLPVLTGILGDGLSNSSAGANPVALIVGPTRELVVQIFQETRKFSAGTNIRSEVVYGGVSVAHHMSKLTAGADIVVATLGRLMDFVRRGIIGLSRVRYLILDEADRMLDMGFKDDILSLCFNYDMPPNTERQTLLFSATFPEAIQQIAATVLNDYIFIAVGRVGGANKDIEQVLELVPLDKKKEKLIDILQSQSEQTKTIVFVEKKVMSDFLAVILCQNGLRTTSIHGDREQREREEALRTLKNGQTPIIVATSVAARGLDIPAIGHVINYDLPKNIDDYVHRIGRTGRCGNVGKATSFYDPESDSDLAQDLQKILAEAQQEVPSWLQDYCYSSSSYNTTDFTTDVRYRGRNDYNNSEDRYESHEAADNWK